MNIDDFLIDKVFEPIGMKFNALTDKTVHFLSAELFVGAMAFSFLNTIRLTHSEIVSNESISYGWITFIFIIHILWIFVLYFQRTTSLRLNDKSNSNTMNEQRYKNCGIRFIILFFSILGFITGTHLMYQIENYLTLFAFYFLVCEGLPPKKKEKALIPATNSI